MRARVVATSASSSKGLPHLQTRELEHSQDVDPRRTNGVRAITRTMTLHKSMTNELNNTPQVTDRIGIRLNGIEPYYCHAGITIYCTDCREILPLLDADAVVTDPPYGVGLEARVTKHSSRSASINYTDDAEYVRGEIVPRFLEALARVRCAMVTPGTRNMWAYPEPAEVGCVFFPNGAGRSRWGFGTFNPILFYGSDPYLAAGLGSRPNGVAATHWLSDAVDHPCPKPLPWMKWMVNRATLPGQTLIDPFCGSGTTLQASKDLGRTAIGIEIEERYCEIAAERLSQEVFDFAGGDQ